MTLSFRLTDVSKGLEQLFSEHFLDRDVSAVIELPAQGLGHSDEQVTQLCAQHVASRFGPLFREGPGKLNPSDADFALACLLAFYCGYDPKQIERIFGQSALALRDKWRRRPEYRRATIVKAIAAQNGVFYSEANPFPKLPDKERLLASVEGAIQGLIHYSNADPETAGLYDLLVGGKAIRCDGLQLRNWPWMAAQFGHAGLRPLPIKQELWQRLLDPWYEKAEERELPPEATERGKLFVHLSSWLRRAANLYREPTLEDRKDLRSGLPVKVTIADELFIAFQLSAFQKFLQNERYIAPRGGHAVFFRILAELGTFPAEDDLKVPDNENPMRVWLMPFSVLPREDEPEPFDPKPQF